MIRCPHCNKACAEQDLHCRHCGTLLKKKQVIFWQWKDWLDVSHALRSLAAAGVVFGIRVLCHPLLMLYQGERHEGRVATFHLCIGIAMGLVAAPLRRESRRWLVFGMAGALGGALSWILDYGYMADHVMLQITWNIINWIKSAVTPQSTLISYGILETMRFLGPVLVLGMLAGWNARPPMKLRIFLGCVMALAIRFPLKGFALTPAFLLAYPSQSILYLSSLFVFFYGLGAVDEDSTK